MCRFAFPGWSLRLPPFTRNITCLIGLLHLCCVGCSETENGRHEVYPTTGFVLVNHQPVAGVQVTLLGATDDLKGANAPIPFGLTDDQGKFTLRTYDPGDGAPAGSYQVRIIWPETPPPGADTEMFQAKDQLKGRYGDPAKSGLTATIAPGANNLPPFELRR